MRYAIEDLPSPPRSNNRRPAIVRFGKKARTTINALVSRFSLVPLDPVLSTDLFPWLRELEAHTSLVQREAEHLMRHLKALPPMNEMSPDHERIAGDGGWRSFFLVGYGIRIEENCARCPATVRFLERVPGLVTALFSILEPGMHVGRHRGVSRGILIAHLGLRIPADRAACRMDVNGHSIQWEEGRTLVFDDTYPHEVWNDTSEPRVIFLVQFRRPMRLVGRMITRLLVGLVRLSPYIQDARRNLDLWERRLSNSESAAAIEADSRARL
jgi:ornithine lipid ester-linked acyl 2-hydroxylase